MVWDAKKKREVERILTNDITVVKVLKDMKDMKIESRVGVGEVVAGCSGILLKMLPMDKWLSTITSEASR